MAETLDAYTKKRIEESSGVGQDPSAFLASGSQKQASKQDNDEEWAPESQPLDIPVPTAVLNVSLTKEREKKKAEEEQKLMLGTAGTSPEKDQDHGKKGKEAKRPTPGGLNFGDKAPMFYSKSNANEFPTLDEAATMKKQPASPPKREERKPDKEKEKTPEKAQEFAMPSFTNTRKKEQGPTFAELKDMPKEHTHEGELIAQPSKEQAPGQGYSHAPRQFEVAGDKKEHREKKEWSYKPYEGSPSDKPKPDSKPEGADYHPRFHHGDAGEHKHPYEPRKDYKPSDKVGRKPRTDKDEESAKPSKPAKPAEAQEPPQPKEVKEAKEQQPKKTKGSKVGKPVAKFTASVPAGPAWSLEALAKK